MRLLATVVFSLFTPRRWRRFALLLATAAACGAQSVRWEAHPSSPSVVQLVFEDCSPEGDPALPTIPGVTLSFVGPSENIVMENFQVRRTLSLAYLVRARQNAPVQFPAFSVRTNRGMMQVAPFSLASPSASLESVANSRLAPERLSVWAGEVFGLTYTLTASQRHRPQINQTFDWNPAPLVAEDWPKPEMSEPVRNGERQIEVTYRTRAYAKTPNTVKLDAASHLMNIQTGMTGFGLFSTPRIEAVSVTSDQPVLQVRALPPSPAGFSGAVGQFKLTSKVVPEKATVGEPVTWTLELTGTGNWPDIPGLPARDVSRDFHVVQPKAKRTPAEGKLFDATFAEDVVLVPTKPGEYTLGPVSFVYFDPASGGYKTITAPRTTVSVAASTVPRITLGSPAVDPARPNPSPAEPPSAAAPAAPAPPSGIPRDPLTGSAVTNVPMSAAGLRNALLAPVAFLLLFWLGLAVRRARQTDPLRARREAYARLGRTLSHVPAASGTDQAGLLLAWQRDAATLFDIPHAAPRATAFPDRAWAQLWTEAERAMYGIGQPLPADWAARAQEALASRPVPGFRPWRLFLPRNIFPFAAAIAVTLVMLQSTVAGESAAPADERAAAIKAYQRGEFAAAEKTWRNVIKAAPTDWIARHNLSLALAQQERPGEAAAQAAAAFVQAPDHPAVRWHFGLVTQRGGFVPPPLAGFVADAPAPSIARAAAPSTWQRRLIAATALVAGAVGWALWNAYGARRRRAYLGAAVAGGLGLLGALWSTTGLMAYQIAAHPDAVVVARSGTLRSIPTEADTTQKTTSVAAGATGIADFENPFLGWTKITFPNGQSGWLRREELVGLWR